MATATATPSVPPTLEGHAHEFQYLKQEEEDQSQLQLAAGAATANDNEVSPHDILAQLTAAEQNTASVLTPTEATSERTPTQDNKTLEPPSAPMKQKEEQYFQYYDQDAESVEISHLIPKEEAPPSPIPYVPEEDDGPIDEPFDCMPVDESEAGILKRLEKVVSDSDRVLHPNHYNKDGKINTQRKEQQQEMALMTPVRSGDPMKSPANSDCGNSTVTGATSMSRASVKILGKNKRPQQPIMKLRVNDSTFEPLAKVQNQVEDLPFDETTSHNFKTAIRNIYTTTKAAVIAQAAKTDVNGCTPDTTLMEDTDTDDDTTTVNYGDDDEWTADTSRYTGEYTEGTDTDEDTTTLDDGTYDDTMNTPMDEMPSRKSAKARRRHKLLQRSRQIERKSKEEQGWDETLLDAVFSPDVIETGLEMADFIQSGAEATAAMTKEILQDAVKKLEQEERALNGDGEVATTEEDQEDEATDAGEGAYRGIAAAAAANENENNEEDDEDADTYGYNGDNDTATVTTNKNTTNDNEDADAAAGVKDPWDQPENAYTKEEEEANFTDLLQKGLPLVNRKLERIVNDLTKNIGTGSSNDSTKTDDAVMQEKGAADATTAAAAEDRVSAEETGVAAAGDDEEVAGDEVVSEQVQTAAEPSVETPFAEPADGAEEEKKEAEKEDDNDNDKKAGEETSSVMAQMELEDPQASEEASTGESLLSLEKPTKRLSV